jgi:hypothetical protein
MTMPTREEILSVNSDSEAMDMLRRIADAMDGCVKEAERYRWLRDANTLGYGLIYIVPAQNGVDAATVPPHLMDAVIDRAMLAAAHDRAENCEHSWATDGIGPTKCLKCGDTSDAFSRKLMTAASKENGNG